MTFFKDFPIPEPAPRGGATRFVPPPWLGPPLYELPAVRHIGKFLHRSPAMIVAVKSVDVFAAGCSFSLTWIIRRDGIAEEDWAEKHQLFFNQGMGPRHGLRAGRGLMFGVQLSDGAKASTVGFEPHAFMGTDQKPEPPTLTLNNGGGSGADDELSGTGNLWLWPLPPAGTVRLVTQWLDFGLTESSIELDGGLLREAAADAQRFWEHEQNQP